MGRIELPSNFETSKIIYKLSLIYFKQLVKSKISKTLTSPH